MYAHAPLGKSLLRSLLRPGAPARVLGLQASGDRLLIRAMASTGAQTYAMTGVASPEDRHGWPACCCHSPARPARPVWRMAWLLCSSRPPAGRLCQIMPLPSHGARRPWPRVLGQRSLRASDDAAARCRACPFRASHPPMAGLPGRVCREVIQIIPLFRLRRVLLKDRCCFLFLTTAAPTNGAAC